MQHGAKADLNFRQEWMVHNVGIFDCYYSLFDLQSDCLSLYFIECKNQGGSSMDRKPDIPGSDRHGRAQ